MESEEREEAKQDHDSVRRPLRCEPIEVKRCHASFLASTHWNGAEELSERLGELVPWRASPYVARGTTWQESGLRDGFKTRRQKTGVKFT